MDKTDRNERERRLVEVVLASDATGWKAAVDGELGERLEKQGVAVCKDGAMFYTDGVEMTQYKPGVVKAKYKALMAALQDANLEATCKAWGVE